MDTQQNVQKLGRFAAHPNNRAVAGTGSQTSGQVAG